MILGPTIRRDLRRLTRSTNSSAAVIVRGAAWRALLLYRVTEAARRHRLTRVLALPLSALQMALHGLDIAPGATIGAGVHFAHPVGCVIASNAVLDDDVKLLGSVTIGAAEGSTRTFAEGAPRIERGAVLGAGCRVIGPVTVGAGARIGANATVTSDVPANTTAIGNPAVVRVPATP